MVKISTAQMQLWEILVPTTKPDNSDHGHHKIKLGVHEAWDKKIHEIAGGLTILQSTKGKWKSPSGKLFAERMIPVRIACTEEQIRKIVQLTIEHYEQEAVMAYCVSHICIIEHKGDGT